MITLGSLFDGIGGWPLAVVKNNVIPLWASEIAPFPKSVTGLRFPDMKQLGDVQTIDGAKIEPVDIICMGSPCQDLSTAGKQEGLNGKRSKLFFAGVSVIRQMRKATQGRHPQIVVWENVPGAFNSNKGLDFRAVLEAISQTEVPMPRSGKWANAGLVRSRMCDITWRQIDAQYWGVPQRRKRIFLIADFRITGRCAEEILFECAGLSGDSASGERTSQGIANTAAGSIRSPNKAYRGLKVYGVQGSAICPSFGDGRYGKGLVEERAYSLRTTNCQYVATVYDNHWQDSRMKECPTVSPTLTTRIGTGGNNQPIVSYCIAGNTIARQPKNGGNGIGIQPETSYTLNTVDRHAVAYGIGQNLISTPKELPPPIVATDANMIAAVDCRNLRETGICGTLTAKTNGSYSLNYQNPVRIGPMIRRFTPMECERLQGLPDDWTQIEDKTCSDGARYSALGNGMAQPCADWVIKRIVESLRKGAALMNDKELYDLYCDPDIDNFYYEDGEEGEKKEAVAG